MEDRLRRIPIGRFGVPGDIAMTALFLASEDSNYINGHILKVDGGFTAVGTRSRD
jgi:NAD(P)-dependent dehydrogenase (short-subunit alcohol dehydrogenase family)